MILPGGRLPPSTARSSGSNAASGYFATARPRTGTVRDRRLEGVEMAKGWGTYIENGSSKQFAVKWSKAERGATSVAQPRR